MARQQPLKMVFNKEKSKLFLYIACVYIILFIARSQELFQGLEKIYLLKIVGAIATIGLIINFARIRERIKYPQVKGMFGIIFLGVITVPFSVWPGYSFSFLINYYWKVLLIFFLIFTLVKSRDDINKVIWGFLISVIILCISSVVKDLEGVFFPQGRLYVSTMYDSNDLSLIMDVALPFAVFGFLGQKGLKKLVFGCFTALIIMTIILTASRGGFLGFLGGSFAILVSSRKMLRKIFVPLMIIIGLGSAIFVFYAKTMYWERMRSITTYELDYNLSANEGRIEIWKRGMKMMISHPIIGVGVAGFTTAEGESHKDIGGKWSTAHNSFIQIGAELGFIGLFLFCYIIWASLKGINKAIKTFNQKKKGNEWILFTYTALGCSWVAYIIAGFFLSSAYSPVFFLLAGLSATTGIFNNNDNGKVNFKG